jgi:hypothetical protein
MVAHTGFLIFGRRIEPSQDERARELLEEQAGGELEEQPATADFNNASEDDSQ